MHDSAPIRVLLICGYPLLEFGFKHALAAVPEFRLVDDQRSAAFDVAVVVPSPGETDPVLATERAIERLAGATVVMPTAQVSDEQALQMFRAGARSVLPLSTTPAELLTALHRVARSGVYVIPGLQERYATVYVRPPAARARDELSLREQQVLRLLARGHTHQEIALMLSIGVKTVDTHRANLLRKLGLRNNADLTRYAIRTRSITLD